MRQRVYIATTIVSYLTAKPSRDLIIAAHQEVTREWWAQRRRKYDLFVSEFVLNESRRGDADAVSNRLQILEGLQQLRTESQAVDLAETIITDGLLPVKAAVDALHLAMAAVHQMGVLLTWNCRHLANADILVQVGRHVRKNGYELPIVCTPEELMGDDGE